MSRQSSRGTTQELDPVLEEGLQTTSLVRHGISAWRPVWLRRTTLIAFTTLFALFWIVLVVLWYLKNKLNGFPLSVTTNHYAWTYGPTAVLVIVVSLWRQVDYCCKVNQPWQELRAGPQPASQNVLLDYMWPMQFNSFIAAIKNKHLAVVASTGLFALLKTIIVVSTGLFVLRESSFDDDVSVTIKTEFEALNFWKDVAPEFISFSVDIGPVPVYSLGGEYDDTTFANLSSDPVWSYMINSDATSVSPATIAATTAMTNYTIQPPADKDVYEALAAVEVFMPNVTCSPISLSYNQTLNDTSIDIQLDTPDCHIGTVNYGLCFGSAALDNCTNVSGRTYQVDRVNCTGNGTTSAIYLDNSTRNTYQYVITALDYTLLNATENQTGLLYLRNWTGTLNRAVSVSCNIEYYLGEHIATTNGGNGDDVKSIGPTLENPTSKIYNFTDLQFSEAVFSTLRAATSAGMFDGNNSIADSMGGYTLINLMAQNVSNEAGSEGLFDTDTLRTTAENVLNGVSHQLMKRYFLAANDREATGTIKYRQIRLNMRPAALWVMVGLFGFGSLLPILVMMTRRTGVAPRSPSSLATSLALLSASPSMQTLLRDSGAKRNSQLDHDLQGMCFGVDREEPFVVLPMESPAIESSKKTTSTKFKNPFRSGKPSQKKEHKPKEKAEWMPYSARRHAITLTLSLPLLAIAALELLWYFSQHRTGFVNTNGDSSVAAYAIRYSCTTIALIIATLVNNLDFAIAVMTPLNPLRVGLASPQRSIFFSIVGDLPPIAFYKAVRHRHLGAALSITASTIGSILTIIVSGLWVLDDSVVMTEPVSAKITTTWDLGFKLGAEGDNGAATLFNSIQHGSVDRSDNIWQDRVLPVIGDLGLNGQTFPGFASKLNQSSVRYKFDIPTVLPYLDCEVLPQSVLVVNQTIVDGAGDLASRTRNSFGVTFELPAGCTVNSGGGSQNASFGQVTDANRSGALWIWIGSIFDLNVKGTTSATNGCPSIGGYYGRSTGDPTDNTLTPFVCYQRMQEAQTSVTYSGDASNPIANLTGPAQVDLQTAKVMRNTSDGLDSLSFTAIEHMAAGLTTFSARTDERFDNFFDHLTYGPGGASRESRLGPDNTENLLSAINKLYQGYMAHVIDLNFRSTSPDVSQARERLKRSENVSRGEHMRRAQIGDAITGTATGLASRLKINETSKLTLQIMLGAIFPLSGLAYWLTDLRGTLPRSPCSIASTMALFAGSTLVAKNIKVERGGDEQGLSLGWWDVGPPPAVVEGAEAQALDRENGPQGQPVQRTPVPNRTSLIQKRFGIDIGTPDMAGYSKKGAWRRRLPWISRSS